jgi:hypothetical protein
VVVNGVIYANGKRPWFTGTAAAGSTVQLILSGSMVVGKSKIIGTVVANAANSFRFQLPAGLKNGTYSLVIHVIDFGSPVQVSTPLSFRAGPIPKVKVARRPPVRTSTPHKAATPAKPVVKVHHSVVPAHPLAVASASSRKTSVVDQALHALGQNPLLRKNKGH